LRGQIGGRCRKESIRLKNIYIVFFDKMRLVCILYNMVEGIILILAGFLLFKVIFWFIEYLDGK